MNTYLQIAETVLRATKRPMSARSILKEAYKADLVPYRLHGETQHKTLQARLSIDILDKRESSSFFRNGPGRFFLREFMTDSKIPSEFRKEVIARRRTRDLIRGQVLVAQTSKLEKIFHNQVIANASQVVPFLESGELFSYEPPSGGKSSTATVWVFAVIRREDEILSFRCGNYRDYRDSFSQKRSLGFSAVVTEKSRNLFNFSEFGISDCGLNAVSADLNLSATEKRDLEDQFPHHLKSFLLSYDRGLPCMVAILEINAPDWFEPFNSSLSINDLSWLRLDISPNNLEDFDPWSQLIFKNYLTSKDGNAREQKIG